MKKLILTAITFVLIIFSMQAQKQTNIWHFGYNTGLDFNTTSTKVGNTCWWNGSAWSYTYNVNINNVPKEIKGYVNTMEGCFSISDASGNLLISSDGSLLYNKNGTQMNTTSLGGHTSATQSGIVIPKPGDPDSYYAVSVNYNNAGPIQWAEVDMTKNGGLGGIVSQNNKLLLPSLTYANENIAAVQHANGEDFWLLHRTGPNFYVWAVTATGFTYKGAYSTSSTSTNNNYIGELCISSDGSKIVAINHFASIIISADFDNSTGVITNAQAKVGNTTANRYPYSGCFSPNGEYFYCNITDNGALAVESYCISWSALRGAGTIAANKKPVPQCSNIKIGPDGRLYGIRRNQSLLLVIEDPNNGDLKVNYINNFFTLGTPQAGLPNFLASIFSSELEIYPLACSKYPRDISVEITSGGASPTTRVEWNFGDGSPIVSQTITPNTTATYTQAHTYSTVGQKTITITPYTAANIAKTPKVFQINVISCAVKSNRMIRTNLKDKGEP